MVADSGPPALQVQDAEPPCETRWLHMSLCNFRNWEFASLEMEEAEDQPSPDKKVLNVPLQPEFRSCYDTFKACIDFNWPWICRLHVIIQDEDLLTMEEMAPNTVEVAALESVPRFRLWKAPSSLIS